VAFNVSPQMEEWLSFLNKWTLLPLATIAVFEGTRRISWGRSGWKTAALLFFGIGALIVNAGSLAWGASVLESTLCVLNQKLPPTIPESALAQMAPQEREEKTRLIAQIAFGNAGALITYISATGQQVRYAPSEKEIRDRESLEVSLMQTRTRLEFIRTQVWIYMLAAISAIAAGLYARLGTKGRREG